MTGGAKWLVLLAALAAGCPRSDPPGPAPGPSSGSPAASPSPPSPPSRPRYLGRPIAPTMGHQGAPWLTRPERNAEEDTDALLGALQLEDGDVACDFGAGNGYHSLRMAEAVAPGGKVVAVDIQPEMLALLKERAADASITNVETLLATPDDARLPPASCDLILLVDVYHELDDPPRALAQLRRALTPGGTIALAEFRGEDPAVPIKPLHKMTRAQILREYEANGLSLKRSFDDLPWQHLMFFAPAK